MPSLQQLHWADCRVRSYIHACLKRRVSDFSHETFCKDCLRDATFQLAFCYRLGFGVSKDDRESRILLEQSTRQLEELEHQIDLVKAETVRLSFHEGKFKQLFDKGHMKFLQFSTYYGDYQQRERISREYRREIA